MSTRTVIGWTVVAVMGLAGLTGCRTEDPEAHASASPSRHLEVLSVESTPTAAPSPRTATPLLQQAHGGDGDSWKDTAGREYRLGLVNAPETNECYGSAATSKRKELVAAGFRAQVYTHDTYGRAVSVVSLADGTNLNVWLARHGYVNDKYLTQFRHENPSLAAQLDVAFAAAKRDKAGLWAACVKPAAPTPQPVVHAASACHPDYLTCIPIKGDGSGNGEANDLDCPDIREQVQVRNIGTDPYGLDADNNGIGCESY